MEAVIFDMDGVLVDSEAHWPAVEKDFLRELAPDWTDEEHRGILGMSIHDVFELLRSRHGTTVPHPEFVNRYAALARTVYGTRSNLLPGARELLDELRTSRTPIGLASSSPRSWINIVLTRFSLESIFDHVTSGDDVKRGKPDPEIYIANAQGLGASPERCVAIEDSPKGIASAKAAGMHCIALRNGLNDDEDMSAADTIVDNLNRLSLTVFRGLMTT